MSEKRTIIYGKYKYKYNLLREDRKTLSLIVRPDLSIFIKSPLKADIERIEGFFKRKWLWLIKQLNYFQKYHKKIYKKDYVSGESFLYLGRQYQLIVKKSIENRLVLKKGKLLLYTKEDVRNSKHNQTVLNNWYKEKTVKKFQERLNFTIKNFNYKTKPQIVVRKMKKRWGSFHKSQKIILNPELIKASTDCIDYVITHELCHKTHKKHDKKFWKSLDNKYPGWEEIKEKLELKLG